MKRPITFYPTSFNSSKKNWEQHDVFPRERVIKNLLNYSRALSVIKTQTIGYFNIVMN
ncbi:MAG: hypothetical protein Q8867_02800 [Bacteroidota bacterium]|nr:hypothetical protein [Bacteroidota bacterium]